MDLTRGRIGAFFGLIIGLFVGAKTGDSTGVIWLLGTLFALIGLFIGGYLPEAIQILSRFFYGALVIFFIILTMSAYHLMS